MKTLKAVYLVTVITGLLTGLSLSSSASAQDISGTWHGKLTVPTGSLTLVFHINQTGEGTYITTLDSPDQGANGIKTQTTSFKDSILTVQIPVIHASYKGKLSNDRSISGTFTQGIPLPLNLEKGEASRSKRPQEPQPPFSYKSEEVTVRNEQDGINLAGTFTLPEKGTKFPAVMTIALNRYRHDAANGTIFSPVEVIANVYYFFFRCLMDSPFNSILFELATRRSIIASAKVGSPI